MSVTEYYCNDIVWATEKLKEHILSLEKENAKLKKGLVGEILPVEKLPWADFWGVYQSEEAVFRYLEKNFKTPNDARKAFESTYKDSLPVIERNRAAVANNLLVFENLVKAFESLGLKTHYRKYKGNTLKYNEIEHEWHKELRQTIPKQEPLTLDSLEKQHRLAIDSVKKWENKIEAAQQKIEYDRVQNEKKVRADRLTGILAQKYGVDLSSDGREVLDILLLKDKYLRLAYYLEKNRGDWNDGYSYAETGLRGFTCENDIDGQIVDEITSLIEDWDGDGRCFRDCQWNYSALYEIAKTERPELYADFKALMDSRAVSDS